MAGDVRVVYRKHDGSLHWHLMTRWLGEDEHGVALTRNAEPFATTYLTYLTLTRTLTRDAGR